MCWSFYLVPLFVLHSLSLSLPLTCFQACFWYTGVVPNDVLRFRGYSGSRSIFLSAPLDPTRSFYGDWKFVCIDMLEVLSLRFDDGALNYVVDRIFFDFASNENQEVFWIDEFYVTTSFISGTCTSSTVHVLC